MWTAVRPGFEEVLVLLHQPLQTRTDTLEELQGNKEQAHDLSA